MAGPLITLTSDFGLTDASVAICKGVILGIAPDARLLDISHGVTHYATAEGAALLWAALPHMPVGVHMAVVDPGVGTDRRPLALRTGRGDFLVGPDNGLLLPAADRLGGVAAAHLLANPAYRLPDVSRTFHARDVFAPAAGHLAAGIPIEAFGPALALGSLVRLDLPEPRSAGGALEASVALIDAFGSAQLLAEIGRPGGCHWAGRLRRCAGHRRGRRPRPGRRRVHRAALAADLRRGSRSGSRSCASTHTGACPWP